MHRNLLNARCMGRAGCCSCSFKIRNYRYMLSACVWLANDLYTSTVAKVEESSSACERQNWPAIG